MRIREEERTEELQLLTVDQVADLLAVPKSWIYGRSHAGTLPFPAVKVGCYLRFRQSDIKEYLLAQEVK